MLPLMHLENFKAALSRDDLDITIYNSFNGDIIGLGVDFLENALLPVVMYEITQGVP